VNQQRVIAGWDKQKEPLEVVGSFLDTMEINGEGLLTRGRSY